MHLTHVVYFVSQNAHEWLLKSRMIIVKLQGGLGNQMFQYAVGRRLALKERSKLLLDLRSFQESRASEHAVRRDYGLGEFDLQAEIASAADLKHFFRNRGRLERGLRRLLRWPPYTTYHEPSLHYDPAVLSLPDDTYLSGYWQHVEYFQDIEHIIRRDFCFKYLALSPQAAHLATESELTESVCIHVRRGDYVQDAKTNAFHGAIDTEYLQSAVSTLVARLRSPCFYVFSDDISWCMHNLHLEQPTIFVDSTLSGGNAAVDLHLMTHCKHFILSNSSFSWWGAWLSNHPGKLVVAPQRWFATPQYADCTPALPEWIKL